MSEFEKWFWTDFDPDDGDYSIEIYIKVKQGWIAALKWVLEQTKDDIIEMKADSLILIRRQVIHFHI